MPRPLWTDSLGVGWAKWKEANLWRQMSPSANPSSCQIFWGNSLTSPSLSFLICQTGIMRIHPSPVVECPVQGQGSVSATCHPTPLSSSSSPGGASCHLQKTLDHPGQVTLWTPIHTPASSHRPFTRAYIQTRLVILILNSVRNLQVQTQRGPLCK